MSYQPLQRDAAYPTERALAMDALLVAEAPKAFKVIEHDVPATDVMGVWVSQWTGWDGVAIMEVTFAALGDSNFHTFEGMVRQLWEAYEAADAAGVERLQKRLEEIS